MFGPADTYTYGHANEDALDGLVDGTCWTVVGTVKNGAILRRFIITMALTLETEVVPEVACEAKVGLGHGVKASGTNREGFPTNFLKKGV